MTAVLQQPEPPAPKRESVVIKKYANRRLYNTETSAYVTLDDLATMVRNDRDFVVYDAKTGDDLTHSVLTQIIVEQESRSNQTLLPIPFLRQLIRFYGDSMQAFVPGFLEFSLENLGKEQEKFRAQMMDAWGGDAFKAMQDQAQRNMAMFSDAMKVFNPFAAAMGSVPGAPAPGKAAPQGGSSKDDLQVLKDQLAAMQQKLDTLTNK